jgi:hypothetical protein
MGETMKRIMAVMLFVLGLMFGATAHAQTDVTFKTPVTAQVAPGKAGCVGFGFPLNCAFTDANGNYARVYFFPGVSNLQYVALSPLPGTNGVEGVQIVPITGYTQTIPAGSFLPSTMTFTFQGTFYDGEDQYQVIGSATVNLTWTRVFRSYAPSATLTSLSYSF